MSSSPEKLKLTYFDMEGRAEYVRLALVLSGTPFQDERIKREQWAELKPKTPGGQLPVLSIGENGSMHAQSMAMLRWIGATKSTTLYPMDKIMEVEEAIGVIGDIEKEFMPALYMGMRAHKYGHPEGFQKTEQGKKLVQNMRETFIKDTLPHYLERLTNMIAAHGGNWLVKGEKPTVADCYAIPTLRAFTRGHIDYVPTNCLDGYPAIVKYIKEFCALEEVKGRYNNGLY